MKFFDHPLSCLFDCYSDHFYNLSATWIGYWHQKPILEGIIPLKVKMCKMYYMPKYPKIWRNGSKTEEQENSFIKNYRYDSCIFLTHILLRFFRENGDHWIRITDLRAIFLNKPIKNTLYIHNGLDAYFIYVLFLLSCFKHARVIFLFS